MGHSMQIRLLIANGFLAAYLISANELWASMKFQIRDQPVQESSLLIIIGVSFIALAGLLRSRFFARISNRLIKMQRHKIKHD